MKRFWGYLKNEKVQSWPHTLDVLARFVGYKNDEDFLCAGRTTRRKVTKNRAQNILSPLIRGGFKAGIFCLDAVTSRLFMFAKRVFPNRCM